jgi:DNA-binding GntR family transcriptional regulator
MTHEPAASLQLPRATFASMVTERLRDSIVNGTLKPGTQLSEVDLAHSFGVSRGPVREAIQRLVQEGLLRSESHRGVFVPVLTDADVADVYFARAAVESAALRRLIASPMSRSFEILDEYVAEMESAESRGDWEALGRFDLEFHTALVASTGSQRLQRMFTTLISETRLCLAALTGAEARHGLVTEHRDISEAVRDGDTERALAVLEKHYHGAVASLTSTQRRSGVEGAESDEEIR